MPNEIRPIDANALILEMAAGCVPIDRPNISDVTGDEASILDYVNAAPTLDYAPVSRWISVKERLPEDDSDVLVVINGCVWIGFYRRPYRRPSGWWSSYNTDEDNVTHWMPLPEPPKEDV